VYLARETLPERHVAIKVLDEELSARLGRERFVREVEVTSKLGHPHIVPILAAGDADGTLYYVMPFIQGDSLRTRLEADGSLSVDDAVRAALQVADALEHAHQKDVVHRDIKPANVLFQSGHALVADFGIARALSSVDTQAMTQAGYLLGTPDYMSPEQIQEKGNVDARTDIYALGCVLFEMLGGEPPFHSRSPQATLARHLADSPPSLRTLRPGISEEIEAVVARALAKVPEDRFASAADFARALQAAASPARATSSRSSLERSTSAFAVSLRVAGTLLVVGALGFAWQAWSSRDPQPVSASAAPSNMDSVAVMPFEDRTGRAELSMLGQSVADEVIRHLAGVGGVRVTNSYSVQSLWGQNLGIRRLLDTLNVGRLIQGYYEVRGEDLFLTVTETDATEAVLSSNTYRAGLTNLSANQLVLAHDVAAAHLARAGIVATLDEGDESYGPGRNAYITANDWIGQRTPEAMAQAISHFRQAIALEPDYAEAHAGLSSAYALSITYNYNVGLTADDLARRSIQAADSAIKLDPELAAGYSSRGYVLALLGIDLDQAEADFETATALLPSGPNGLSWSARILAQRGQVDEALEKASFAVEIDPVAAGRRIAVASLAFQLGDYERAVSEARAALTYEPALTLATSYLARALAMLGRGAECLDLDLGPYQAIRAACLHSMGRQEEARALADSLGASFSTPTGPAVQYRTELLAQELAAYYAWTGEESEALRWTRAAFARSAAGIDARILGSAMFAPLLEDDSAAVEVQRVQSEARARVAYTPSGR